jgi:DNA-binding GntR family transcriptional regulator
LVRIAKTGLTLGSSAYEAIRLDIIEGRVHPGSKLQFDALRERYGIGISPIREALSRLQSEGWVDREEQRGYRVARVSKDELLELVKTRILIEGLAVREALSLRDAKAEEDLVLAFHRLSKTHRLDANGGRNLEWEKLHRQFHLTLVAGCHMKWIQQFCQQLFDVAERYRLQSAVANPERRELEEHRAMLDAYVSGDAEKVRGLLRDHYQTTVDYVLQHRAELNGNPALMDA